VHIAAQAVQRILAQFGRAPGLQAEQLDGRLRERAAERNPAAVVAVQLEAREQAGVR
jgi:hypothetical protein